ncbi:MAG TPA: MlaD family protein [Opitutaceae bacterium]|nr:MlaD family protein [Opitutaceae bacterium]
MTGPPLPKVSRAPAFPLIWVVPILALAIGGWMLVGDLVNRGPVITIDFADGSGVESGKTTLLYLGVSAGTVTSVALKPGLTGVTLCVRLDKSARSLARQGSQFWIVHPEIGFSGVKGLETLVTGVRLNVTPGTGPVATRFKGLDKAPAPDVVDVGRAFLLQCDRLGSLTTGAPVFYRELKVGAVEASRLSADSTSVLVRIHLEAPYVNLVRTNTRFWNTGGFSFKMNLFGAELKDTSLESLISGGVAFATPDTLPLAPAAADGTQFGLASEPDKEWLKWSPKIPVASPESADAPSGKSGMIPALLRP